MASSRFTYGSVEIYHSEVLGIGSYGKVCKAKCGQLPCAAKLLHDTLFQDNDPGIRNLVSKFLQECQFLSTIKHPNIVQYLGTASDPQSRRTVLLMELMDESLTRFLERLTGPLPYHSQLNICHDVALALAYLHSNAIIHRDLSSNNVLLIGEGSRAKVTDFGMSKLMDMNPRMTPLTQVPGTPAYMPPEALIAPPHYSSKLDCFSHGVLALQIITRNFPNPGDATKYIEDPKYPTGRLFLQLPETERRKKDIDLIEPSHPLLPTALHCLEDREEQRPSANELCGRLASLKREPRYTRSVEQAREHVQRLQEEVNRKDGELERGRAELSRKDGELERGRAALQRANEEISRKDSELERGRANEVVERILEEKEKQILQLQEKVEALEMEPQKVHKVPGECGVGEQPSGPLKLTWRQGQPTPAGMASLYGAAVVHGSTAYFSSAYQVYSYTVAGDKWTTLPKCQYGGFVLTVINNKLTTIGGWDYQGACTNTLLSLSGSTWEEVLPPMPTKRVRPAAANTPTHLVVAGGGTTIYGPPLATVEVLNTESLQWSTASSLPEIVLYPQITECGGRFYLTSAENNVFTCSVEDLLESTSSSDGGSVWTRAARIPTPSWSTPATLRGRVLVIGGEDGNPTGTIHCYDVATNSWSVIGEIPTPRSRVLTAVLPSNELVVVGGVSVGTRVFCDVIEICNC